MKLSGLESGWERVPQGTGVQGPGSLDMHGWPASAGIQSAFSFGVFQRHILRGKSVSEWPKSEYFSKTLHSGKMTSTLLKFIECRFNFIYKPHFLYQNFCPSIEPSTASRRFDLSRLADPHFAMPVDGSDRASLTELHFLVMPSSEVDDDSASFVTPETRAESFLALLGEMGLVEFLPDQSTTRPEGAPGDKGPVPIPADVLAGIEAVRQEGRTNMLNYPAVIRLARKAGHPPPAGSRRMSGYTAPDFSEVSSPIPRTRRGENDVRSMRHCDRTILPAKTGSDQDQRAVHPPARAERASRPVSQRRGLTGRFGSPPSLQGAAARLAVCRRFRLSKLAGANSGLGRAADGAHPLDDPGLTSRQP